MNQKKVRPILPAIFSIFTAGIPTILSQMHRCSLSSPILELVVIPIVVILGAFCWTIHAKTQASALKRALIVFIFSIATQFIYLDWLHSNYFPEALLAPELVRNAHDMTAHPILEVNRSHKNEEGFAIQYTTEDGTQWLLTYNKSEEFKHNPDVYGTFTVWNQSRHGVKHLPKVLQIGSVEESGVLRLLHDFANSNMKSDTSDSLEVIKTILKDKRFDP